ncbi:MAG: sodium/glutamate symporter [Synergistaceae bacterium]|jgi:ESS family glutamate:Na+ symporter|nr:sodium/glutamate symporter [Synergistaceae bacterium]
MDVLIYFDIVQTVAFAAFLLFVGAFLRSKISVLSKYNIPTPVIGGLLFAFINWGLQSVEIGLRFDMTLQNVFMIAFFTSIGLGASIRLLKEGGAKLVTFLIVAAILTALQNAVAWGLSIMTGINPLLGLLAGSITMTGGHGTGATFANYFIEQFHLAGAMELAMAAATFGLVAGSLLGGPVARFLIMRGKLKPTEEQNSELEAVEEEIEAEEREPVLEGDILRSVFQLTLCMSVGAVLYNFFNNIGVKVPTYLFSLFVGIVIRNVADYKGLYRINIRLIENMGSVSLSIFLAMALMSLKLWQLVDLAIPMLVILAGQVVLMAAFALFITFRFNGRDYDAAVLAGGHCGFGLGATPNAIANMQAISDKYGPSPRAFFLISIVGAFFIDIVNAFVIQVFVSLM